MKTFLSRLRQAIKKDKDKSREGLTVIRVDAALPRLMAKIITGASCLSFIFASHVFTQFDNTFINPNLHSFFSYLSLLLTLLLTFIASTTAFFLLINLLLFKWFLFTVGILVISVGFIL